MNDAGLDELAYRGPVSGDWLTLRQMIDTGQRVLFMAENQAGAAPWYHPVHDRLPASCGPNRGPEDAPLFLINHWITTDPVPLPSNAEKDNADDALLKRARECRRLREHLPNLVAVDFYRRGDLFRVVETLNGVA